jgi:hypothetical protein
MTENEPKKKKIVIGGNPLYNLAIVAALLSSSPPLKRYTGKPCLCGAGTFRDSHATNCDEDKE